MTRIWVDPWDPSFGSAVTDGAFEETTAKLTLDLEVAPQSWAPIVPAAGAWIPDELLVVDGVRRIDARVWFSNDEHQAPALGLAASVAAGVVRIDGRARVEDARVQRDIYTSYPDADRITTPVADYPVAHTAGAAFEDLQSVVQNHMHELEVQAALATRNTDNDLLLLDGPLYGRASIPRTLGYIKTHNAAYLPPELNAVVAALQPAQRTPVFTIGTTWERHTWYLRLPTHSSSPWAGIIRCEAADTLSRTEVVRLADTSARVLPSLASTAYKDARAPQNLIPIGGLEKTLHHRLGDAAKLHRALVTATFSD
jgi:hypothetical protein